MPSAEGSFQQTVSYFTSFALSRFFFISCIKMQPYKDCLRIICTVGCGGLYFFEKQLPSEARVKHSPLFSSFCLLSVCSFACSHSCHKNFGAILRVLKAISGTFLSYLLGYFLNLFSHRVVSKIFTS